jgi:site-specific DNA-methyltransferase (adenine-specific)
MIINNDCLVHLKSMKDNSIDSVVTDPPYGISFMNKHWDYDVPSVDIWKEVLRVLKPGGHIFCACGTRTQHRMTVNIEDAGFEIRDVVAWIYGSGFPKSLNIGKAIDKQAGLEREVVGQRTDGRYAYGFTEQAKRAMGDIAHAEVQGFKGEVGQITKPASEKAQQYEGWGTALKPAMELWTLARKPLEQKTVAENVLKYGTGGINIDGCRVEYGDENEVDFSRTCKNTADRGSVGNFGINKNKQEINLFNKQGRFPANVILSDDKEVTDSFPNTKSGLMKQHIEGGEFNVYGKMYPRDVETIGDSGSASRFFYCAKASKSERNKGCDDFEEQVTDDGREKSIDNAFLRAETMRKNNHPTVKPVSLMRYLCRMITPKNGIVLDPFMGSGSTGIGAKLEGFSFIGIEREEEYCKIAEARIAAWGEEEKVKEVTETITHKITRIQNEIKQKTELRINFD